MSINGHHRQVGFSLIEVLVSMVIIVVGVLGVAGLQARTQLMQMESYQRAQALILLADIADRLVLNRVTASCFAISDPTTGTPFIGADETNHQDMAALTCTAGTTSAYKQQAIDTINALDVQLQGAAETRSGGRVGAMLGARSCISYSGGVYTVVVTWQGMFDSVAPSVNCANGLYGTTTKRRAVSTTIRFAVLS